MGPVRRVLAVIGAVVLAALVGATAYAAIPTAGSGVFNGCVSKRTGILRVIDPAAGGRCSTIRGLEETPIKWNQTGPAGPVGPAGAPANTAGLTYKRSTSTTVTSPQMAVVTASCDPGDLPVTGVWTVDGKSGVGNQAVFFNVGSDGETLTGYEVSVGRNEYYTGPDPVVAVTVACLNIA